MINIIQKGFIESKNIYIIDDKRYYLFQIGNTKYKEPTKFRIGNKFEITLLKLRFFIVIGRRYSYR